MVITRSVPLPYRVCRRSAVSFDLRNNLAMDNPGYASGLTGPRGRKDGKLFRGPSTLPNTSLRGKVRPCWLKGESSQGILLPAEKDPSFPVWSGTWRIDLGGLREALAGEAPTAGAGVKEWTRAARDEHVGQGLGREGPLGRFRAN
ncbi:uncharacterized protein LOC144303519 [Canis aureus]